jgi:hypothetical protein
VGNQLGLLSTTSIILNCLPMLTITPSAVSFCHAVSDNRPNLEYLGNLYELKATFTFSQKTEAERLWCHLTDNDINIYLLLTASDGYSLWMLAPNLGRVKAAAMSNADFSQGKAIPNLVIHLLQALWLVINDLGGRERVQAFGRMVVASHNLPIVSATELQACLVTIAPPVQRVDVEHGQQLIAEFRRLACLQVGAETVDVAIGCIPITVDEPLMTSIF